MPLHDYDCSHCHTILRDVYRSVAEGAQLHLPPCPTCGAPMVWIPQVGMIDAYEPFQEFTLKFDDGRSVQIDSLSKLRQVERESEQLAAEGRGRPFRFRHYSQDRSNADVNLFGPPPVQDLPGMMKEAGLTGERALRTGPVPEIDSDKTCGSPLDLTHGYSETGS